ARGRVDEDGAKRVAAAFGYSAEDLSAIPEASNLGLSCGNPTAMASLRPGETVLDLGCGGGLDVFLGAKAVGPGGRAIGIDMTEDMIALARANAEKAGHDNVEFHLSEIERMPLESDTVDCIVSNCVINLCPDKPSAFSEMFRVLKPGGRLAISDIALKQSLPDELKDSLDAYVGCIGGAISFQGYENGLSEAGFSDVQILDANADLNAYAEIDGQAGCCAPAAQTSCCGPEPAAENVHEGLAAVLQRYDVNAYAASVKVFAVKPAT
ncbi:MAG: arsenite methyltransferase, partial [Pseudomonadota bacterium]